jgi:hypothetical protein
MELLSLKLNKLESNLLNGYINMDITIRHPFPGNTFFRGFDVRGIIMSEGSMVSKHDAGLKYNTPTQMHMMNPDGFTRWWNQAEFTSYGKIFGYTEGHFAKPGFTATSTLNPFKVFAEGLLPAQPFYQIDFNRMCSFPAVDGVFTRTYKVQFDPVTFPIYRFKYSINACWALPDPAFKPKYPVEAFPPNAHSREPYMVRITEYEEIPYWVDEWVSGGDLVFLLNIGVWQAAAGSVLDNITHVWVESPTLFDNPVDVRDTMEFVESPHPTQATFRVSFEDMLPDGLTGQQLLISVETPFTYKPNIQGDTSGFVYPAGPLAAHCIADVPITNLTPEGDYAYCYFIPDWCATMRYQCASDADNQTLLRNIFTQNIDGVYNDFTHVQSWEGKSNCWNQNSDALADTCAALGYSFERTHNDYFDPTGTRVIIAVLWSSGALPPDPPFTQEEAEQMLSYIANGGLLFFMCESSSNLNAESLTDLFNWLGMLMVYGGGATPEYTDGYTSNITWHFLTDNVDTYHYFTCGQWLTEDPHVLTLISTEIDEKLVLMYPLPLE